MQAVKLSFNCCFLMVFEMVFKSLSLYNHNFPLGLSSCQLNSPLPLSPRPLTQALSLKYILWTPLQSHYHKNYFLSFWDSVLASCALHSPLYVLQSPPPL